MGGQKTEQTKVESRSDPWAPAQPLLKDIIGQLQPMVGASGVNPNESSALAGLRSNAMQPNAYAPQIGMLANDLFSGGNDRTGMLQGSYDQYKTSLEPTARGDFVDPSKNSALQGYLTQAGDDAASRVNSTFAAAGRDFSGAHAKRLGEGVTAATAPILYDAYKGERANQIGAQDRLFGAGGSTAGMLSGLDQTALGNRVQGIGVGGAAQAAQDDPFNRQLAVEQMQRGIPQQNLGWLSSLGIPISGTGGSSSGTSTSSVNDPNAMWKNIIGGTIGGVGMLGNLGAFGAPAGAAGAAGAAGGAGWLSSMLPALALSDRRAKENIEEIGVTHDGQKIYRFRYKDGGPKFHIGLMAQEVETVNAGAVHEIGGIKMVDYKLATDRAVKIGMKKNKKKSVRISADRLRERLHYDPLTGIFRWKVARRAKVGDLAGSRGGRYVQIMLEGRAYFGHRLAWLYMTGNWPSAGVDHKNGDGRDNSWGNLREANQSQNTANARDWRKKSTLPRGVGDRKTGTKRYRAALKHNGKYIFLGAYDTPEAASHAYKDAAREFFGVFARDQ